MKSTINLATHPVINQRGFWLGGALLVSLALLATVFVSVSGVTTWQQRVTTRAQLISLGHEKAELSRSHKTLVDELQKPSTQALLDKNRFLNHMIRQKAFSWATFFAHLEKELPASARILAVTPSLRTDGPVEIRLQLGGQSPEAIHTFLRALEKSTQFTQIVLQSQEVGQNTDDNMLAQIRALYWGEIGS